LTTILPPGIAGIEGEDSFRDGRQAPSGPTPLDGGFDMQPFSDTPQTETIDLRDLEEQCFNRESLPTIFLAQADI
jgi:hypothetical protein